MTLEILSGKNLTYYAKADKVRSILSELVSVIINSINST